jgi:hypothetical protein
MSRRTIPLVIASIAAMACSHAPPPRTATVAQQGAPASRPMRYDPTGSINAAELRRDLYIIADDSFRGRETGTPEARRAAAYIARRVQMMGLEPAGDSLYLQRVPMVRETFASTTQLMVTFNNGQRQNLRLGTDITPVVSIGSDAFAPTRSVDGDVLFVGSGPDDEKQMMALVPLNPQGRIAVMSVMMPEKAPSDPSARALRDSLMMMRVARVIALHPAAVVMLLTGDVEATYRRQLRSLLRNISLEGPLPADSATPMPMMIFGSARRGSPLLPANWPNDMTPQLLDRQFAAHVDVNRTPFTAYNVVAVVRGHDPKLNRTFLAYGAHYDHIGIQPAEPRKDRRGVRDSIANGADDDGSGSVALLAIAQQMVVSRPRRSVLFVWHVGEEQGMLGSSYFTSHSPMPIDSIVAQFNADMIGRNEPNTVGLVGPRAAPKYQSWRLGIIVDSVNRAAAAPLRIERKWDDPDDPEHIYKRSDHYSYAKKGIPIIFFTSGEHEDYHRVSDEASKIDYDKIARVAQLMLEAGLAVSNRSTRPTSEAITESISSRQP